MVVGVTPIVAQETHRVALDNVFRVILDEFLGAVPKSRDGLHILVQTQHETVLLSIIRHVLESIVVDVAEEFNAWLHSPVPLIVQHQFLSEEEARLESAHVSVAYGISVDDLALCHILTNLARLVLIDVFWEGPVLLGNLSIECVS